MSRRPGDPMNRSGESVWPGSALEAAYSVNAFHRLDGFAVGRLMAPLGPREIVGLGFERMVLRAPVAVIVVDASGRVIHANERARELTKHQLRREMPTDLSGALDIFHLDGRPYVHDEWPAVRSIKTGEEVVDEEFFYALPNGDRLFIRCGSSPLRDEGGDIIAGLVVMVDITEDRRIADRLAYHVRLVETSEDAVIAVDPQMRITLWNNAAEQLYGWSADEVLGRSSTEVWHTMIGAELRDRFEQDFASSGRSRMEMTAHRRDGSSVEVEWIVDAVRGAHGEDLGRLGVHRDVSERHRAQEALRGAHRQSEAMLESITDAFYALDRDWRIIYINARAVQFVSELVGHELSRDEVLGQRLWDLLPVTASLPVEGHYRRAVREQRALVFEYHCPDSDPWFDVHAYPSEHGLSVYFQEITDRKAAEAERERRERQQELVSELGLRALASDDLQALMDEAVRLVAETLDVEFAGVSEIVPGTGELRFCAGVGWGPDVVGTMTGSLGPGSLASYTVRAGEPVLSEDIGEDERFTPSPLLTEKGVVSAAAVLIEGHDEPFGALGVFSRQRRIFSADDLHSLQAVANVMSTAMERAAAERRLEEVREAERSRIARDLHDEALQGLTHALALTGSRASRDDEVFSTLQQVGRQLRGAIYDLRLEHDRERPFSEALPELVEVHNAMAPDCEVRLELRDDLPNGSYGRRGTEVLRVIGEALTNARRHATAHRIVVRVTGPGTRLSVEISDDGRGFEPDRQPSLMYGQGLRGMRERAELLDAHLDVRSDRSGTTVRMQADLRAESATRRTRVLLVEDHATVREALAAAFERHSDIEVVGQASSLSAAREQLAGVDVAVIDLGLPDGFGADLIDDLCHASPRAQALVLSGALDRAEIARAVARGAAGVLHKTMHLDDVVAAVRRLRAGETLLPMEEIIELLRFAGDERERERDDRAALAELTPREQEVLQAVAEGLNSRQIADRLHIAVRTERNHIANILAKLGAHSQVQALLLALRYEVVEVPRSAAPRPPPE